mmetsp:Transcript_77681/g.206278  ORF Transcript_77681/g.206278 Transcript_77681/m.206278 type:complete len:206 (-) Transcript_77681:727-1344(-)
MAEVLLWLHIVLVVLRLLGPVPDVRVQPHGAHRHHRAGRERDLEEPLPLRQLLRVQHHEGLHRQGRGPAGHGAALGAHGGHVRDQDGDLRGAPQELGRGHRAPGLREDRGGAGVQGPGPQDAPAGEEPQPHLDQGGLSGRPARGDPADCRRERHREVVPRTRHRWPVAQWRRTDPPTAMAAFLLHRAAPLHVHRHAPRAVALPPH